MLKELNNDLNKFKIEVAKIEGRYAFLNKTFFNLEKELQETNHSIEIFEKTRIFLQKVSEAARHVAKLQVEDTVTKALQYVFGTNYSFKIDIKSTNHRVEADFLVVTTHGDRTIVSMPTTGKGGGIVDLLAVSLKFAILELMDFDGPIWLDEPFKHVSKDYIDMVGRLLTFMGKTSRRQIIIITHNSELAQMCNKTIHITQEKGFSKFR